MKRQKELIADDDSQARDVFISLLVTVPEIELVDEAAKRIYSSIQRYILLFVLKISTVECLIVNGRIKVNLGGNS